MLILFFTHCSKNDTTAISPPSNSDSAAVTVVNGYGTGKYKVGDTVHIWSAAVADNAVFDKWTGYDNLLAAIGEWHNTFIMPAQSLTITGYSKPLPAFTLLYEKIRAKNSLKNVYYYFPAGHKGIVYLLHGTGGSAENIVTNFEWIQMIKDLIAENYAIIVTEAEEITLGIDLNNDGKFRWSPYPADSVNNTDHANIKALTDTFCARGYTTITTSRFSIGMSNGGSFSAVLSALYKFKAGISYCASSSSQVFATSLTPFQFCMAKYDDNAEVGPQGNADALSYSHLLTGRGICSKFFSHDRSPVYPERFARRSDISITASAGLVNELRNNNWLDNKNYLKASSALISQSIQANPVNYPVFNSLTTEQKLYAADQIDVMYAAHQFYSDYNKTTIKFLNTQCN